MHSRFWHSICVLAIVLHHGTRAADLSRSQTHVLRLRGGGDRRMDARENYPMNMRQQNPNIGQYADVYGNGEQWQRREAPWQQGGMQHPMNQPPMSSMGMFKQNDPNAMMDSFQQGLPRQRGHIERMESNNPAMFSNANQYRQAGAGMSRGVMPGYQEMNPMQPSMNFRGMQPMYQQEVQDFNMMPSRAPQQHGGREFFAEYQRRQMQANENLVEPPRRERDRPEFRDRQMMQDKGLNPMGAVQQSYSHRKDFYQSKNDGGTQPRPPYQRYRPGMVQAPGVYKKKTHPLHYPDRVAAMKQVDLIVTYRSQSGGSTPLYSKSSKAPPRGQGALVPSVKRNFTAMGLSNFIWAIGKTGFRDSVRIQQICDILELAGDPAAPIDGEAEDQPPLHVDHFNEMDLCNSLMGLTAVNEGYENKVGLKLIDMLFSRIFQPSIFGKMNLVYVAQIAHAIIKLERTWCPYLAPSLKRMEEELSNTSAEFQNFTTRKQTSNGEDEFRRDLGEPIEFGQSMEDSADPSVLPSNSSSESDIYLRFLDYKFFNDRRSLLHVASTMSILSFSDKWKQHRCTFHYSVRQSTSAAGRKRWLEKLGSARRQQGGFEDEPRGERGRDWISLACRDVAMAQNEDLWKVLCARAEQFWIKSEGDGLKNAASMCQLAQENILNLTGRKNEDLERCISAIQTRTQQAVCT
ncbi:hypothetical protein GUITHDRAFT_131525 [Guillardia theta CCMP2712]|uniref:SBF1/SBF2 domain-containing protein n=1 Tax=Guillardia theta (strain CCMP2712) TaxID=905079 RepID=L1K4B6_GUITC|nr:hypothetical protein GUITHDRAFT_131525 [Guillardia theta CCMP2712]EKX55285.1 hypothetical protein GUITHDRAFT_131525 [Guillardia theta CCMP2712]|eukprot:XP_005842265.1 hypothetical protein GUITHDRAFT_131525 [Guillardia theta CCMP2712]